MAHIDSVNSCHSVLQKTVGKSARGCSDINRDVVGYIQPEMIQRVLQLKAAATDVLLFGTQRKIVARFDSIAGFVGELAVYPDLSCHDSALGLLAAFAQATVNQR